MGCSSVSDKRAGKAIDWFVRLQAEDVTQTEQVQFIFWLKADPANQLALLEVIDLWDSSRNAAIELISDEMHCDLLNVVSKREAQLVL